MGWPIGLREAIGWAVRPIELLTVNCFVLVATDLCLWQLTVLAADRLPTWLGAQGAKEREWPV